MSTIGTNVSALNASFFLARNTDELQKSINRLSSGSRLAVPSDDAAGVAVSGRLDAAVRRLQAAVEGSQNVISMAQTLDGFLSTIQAQLTRMSELAQRATNGAFGSVDRNNYAVEFTRLSTQLQATATNATFNGSSLFVTGNSATIAVAINAQGVTDTFTLSTVGNLASLGITTLDIRTITGAITAISALDTAIASLATRRAEVNADISKFQFHINNIRTEKINVEAANSRIKDLDVASESTNLSKANILLQAATSMLAQANTSQQTVLQLLR